MTDTKPTRVCKHGRVSGCVVCAEIDAATAELRRELAAIKSQPAPVEPELVQDLRDGMSLQDNPTLSHNDGKILAKYIDAILSALQVAQDRADALERDDNQKADANRELWIRAKKAEANLKAAEENVSDLMAMAFKESPVAGGDAVRAADDSLSAAGESPAFTRWAYAEYGDVRPVWVSALQVAFAAGAEKADASNKRLVELLNNPSESMREKLFDYYYQNKSRNFEYWQDDLLKFIQAELLREVGK